ncbi:MAG TPA: hypothetical protein VF174_15825 [Micromonosporaceae bacterium]
MRLRRRPTLVDRLAARVVGLRGDLVDQVAGAIAAEEARWTWAEIERLRRA